MIPPDQGLEGGYTPIPNAILDAFARTQLSGYEWRVLCFILRKTYGWNKESDTISLSQFVDGTGISKKHILNTVALLVEKNIIQKSGTEMRTSKAGEYRFNWHYGEWNLVRKSVPASHLVRKSVPDLVRKSVPVESGETILELVSAPPKSLEDTKSKRVLPPTPTEPTPKKPRAARTPRVTFDRETRQFVGLTPELIQQLREMYPGVDVDQVLREAPDWAAHKQRSDYWGSIKAFCKHDLEHMRGGQYGNGANRQANYRPAIAGAKFTGEDYIRGAAVGAHPGGTGSTGSSEES